MGIAKGGNRKIGSNLYERSACIWGWHAFALNSALVIGIGAAFGIVGAFIGLVIGLLFPDPEPIGKIILNLAAFLIGMFAGFGIGVILAIFLITQSKCPECGYCFCVTYLIPPWPGWIPLWVRPCPNNCAPPPAGLLPSGCP